MHPRRFYGGAACGTCYAPLSTERYRKVSMAIVNYSCFCVVSVCGARVTLGGAAAQSPPVGAVARDVVAFLREHHHIICQQKPDCQQNTRVPFQRVALTRRRACATVGGGSNRATRSTACDTIEMGTREVEGGRGRGIVKGARSWRTESGGINPTKHGLASNMKLQDMAYFLNSVSALSRRSTNTSTSVCVCR